MRCPDRLTSDQCALYMAALMERMMPLEESAREYFEKAAKFSGDYSIDPRWMYAAQRGLDELGVVP